MKKEIWKDIEGYEGLYQISNHGRVKSFLRSREYLLSLTPNKHGYIRVILVKNKQEINMAVHRLVAIHFIPIPKKWLKRGYTRETLQVNHKDENKTNNYYRNLEWCNAAYNTRYSFAHPVSRFDLDGNFICHYPSVKAAAKILHIQARNIFSICKGVGNLLIARGSIWRYRKPEYKRGYKLDLSHIDMFHHRITRPIAQFDLTGKYLKKWISAKEIERQLDIPNEDVIRVCMGKLHTSGRFIWRYWKPEYKRGYFLDISGINTTTARRIKVTQFDLKGNFIKIWDSLTEASKTLHISLSDICLVCKGNMTSAGNYLWRYTCEEHKPGYKLDVSNLQFGGQIEPCEITQFDLDGNFVKNWFSISQASRELNISISCISDCCNNITASTKGMIFKYTKPEFKEGYNLYKINNLYDLYTKPVYQIDVITNKILNEFDCIMTAYKSLQRNSINGWNCIYYCCIELSPIAFGFKWKFKNI